MNILLGFDVAQVTELSECTFLPQIRTQAQANTFHEERKVYFGVALFIYHVYLAGSWERWECVWNRTCSDTFMLSLAVAKQEIHSILRHISNGVYPCMLNMPPSLCPVCLSWPGSVHVEIRWPKPLRTRSKSLLLYSKWFIVPSNPVWFDFWAWYCLVHEFLWLDFYIVIIKLIRSPFFLPDFVSGTDWSQ